MTFTALNQQEETEYDIEQHIREVELENALKLYQDALRLHYKGSWEAAAEAYDSLLASDVLQDVLRRGPSIKPVEQSLFTTTHSSVTLLPYLIFKNHGSLLLDRLRSDHVQTTQDVMQDTLQQVIMEYATALSYESGDSFLWRRLAKLCEVMQMKRVQRFVLDIELHGKNVSEAHQEALLWDVDFDPYNEIALSKLDTLLIELGDCFTIDPKSEPKLIKSISIDEDLDWLTESMVYPTNGLQHATGGVQMITIRPTSCNWYSLIRAIIEKQRVSSNGPSTNPVHFCIEVPEEKKDDVDLTSSVEAYSETGSPASANFSTISVDDDDDDGDELLENARGEEPEFSHEGNSPSDVVESVIDSDVDLVRGSFDKRDTEDVISRSQSPKSDTLGWSREENEDDQAVASDDPSSDPDKDQDEDAIAIMDSPESTHSIEDVALDEHIGAEAEVPHDAEDDHLSEMESSTRESARSPHTPATNSRKRDSGDMTVDEGTDLDSKNKPGLNPAKKVKERVTVTSTMQVHSFNHDLNQIFGAANIQVGDVLNLDTKLHDLEVSGTDFVNPHNDFRLCLHRDWSDEMWQPVTKRSDVTTTALSKGMIFNYPALQAPKKDADCNRSQLITLAARIDRGGSYFRNVNLEILMALLTSESPITRSPYLQQTWSSQLRSAVVRMITAEEELLDAKLCANVYTHRTSTSSNVLTATLSWAQAILEIFLDDFVQHQRLLLEDESLSDTTKMTDRISHWRSHVSTLLAVLPEELSKNDCLDTRFRWACIIMNHTSGTPVDEIVGDYSELKDSLETKMQLASLSLPNCRSIHSVSISALELEISKFSTMDFFNDIFDNMRNGKYDLVLTDLEPVLLVNGQLSGTAKIQMIQQHLARSPLDFHLQLWHMLTRSLVAGSRPSDALICSAQALALVQHVLQTQYGKDQSLAHRQKEVLESLRHSTDLMKTMYDALEDEPQNIAPWTVKNCRQALDALFSLLSFLQIFVYYEDSAADDTSLTRNSSSFIHFRDKMREDLLRTWKLIYLIYRQYLCQDKLDPEVIGQRLAALISFLHEELGPRGYCSLLSCTMLELFESELFRLDRVETEAELVQVLRCRYGLSYQIGSFVPWEHFTKEMQLSFAPACRMLPFMMSFVSERTPGVWLPKSDIRDAIAKLHKSIWSDLKSSRDISSNQMAVDDWLQQEITPKNFRGCLRGDLLLAARDIKKFGQLTQKEWDAASKLNLTLGRIYLSMYKARNKNNSRGIPDLEEAQSFFVLDLYVCPGRVESWKALAFINSMLAGNELSFDAQRIWDHRDDICGLQRQSIQCYMLATSLAIRGTWSASSPPDCISRKDFADLLFEFGLQIYDAARAPLAMECFKRNVLKFVERGADVPQAEGMPEVTLKEAYRSASRCFYRAAGLCTDSWLCYIYLGKAHAKLDIDPVSVLTSYAKAIELAPSISSVDQGPLIQPHHRMLSSIYKYFVADKISIETAARYLKTTPYAAVSSNTTVRARSDVIAGVHAALVNICQADKKHWHHRPVNRLAMMAYEQDSIDSHMESLTAARSKLESLFTAKGSGSALLSIWRPEYERPGRHYHYAFCYTNLYMNILLEQEDMDSLRGLMRRVRKATSNMMGHREIWDTLCDQFLALTMTKNEIVEEDPTAYIDFIETNVFNEIATRLECAAANAEYNPPVLRVLRDFYDLRKLNGGLYDTNKIDDAIITCYLTLYVRTRNSSNTELGLPESSITSALPLNEAGEVEVNGQILAILSMMSAGVETTNDSVSTAAPSPTVTKKGRAKEPKVTRVSRRDILSRSFVLCKPKPLIPESLSIRFRGQSRGAKARVENDKADEERRGSVVSSNGALEEQTDYTKQTEMPVNIQRKAGMTAEKEQRTERVNEPQPEEVALTIQEPTSLPVEEAPNDVVMSCGRDLAVDQEVAVDGAATLVTDTRMEDVLGATPEVLQTIPQLNDTSQTALPQDSVY